MQFWRVLKWMLVLASITISPVQVRGQGTSLRFDGVNDHVEIADNPQWFFMRITMEAWVYPETNGCLTILSRGTGGAASDFIFQIGYNGSACGQQMKIAFWAGNAWHFSVAEVPLNTWTHVAVSYDNSYKTFYINGVQDSQIYYPLGFYAQMVDVPIYIGRQGTQCNCNFFQGQLDNVRIWTTIRSAQEIRQNLSQPLGAASGLIGNFLFDEGGGLVASNSSGTNNGALINGPTWVTTNPIPSQPEARTEGVSDRPSTGATLKALVIPNRANTTVYFEYGPTTSYGSVSAPVSVPSTNEFFHDVAIPVSGLTLGTTYHYRAVASNIIGSYFGDDATFTTLSWAKGFTFEGLDSASIATGDLDGDGKIDIVLSSSGTAPVAPQVWRNLGNATFSNVNAGPFPAFNGTVALGDFNNDGYPDLLFSGTTNAVWRNLGNGTFTNSPVQLEALSGGSASWADFDGDGKLDIITAGIGLNESNEQVPRVQIWRNLGNGSFSNIHATLPQLWNARFAVGDLDKDGKADIVLAGTGGPDPFSDAVIDLWHNLGNGNFTNLAVGFPNLVSVSLSIVDIDSDGWPDIALAGELGFPFTDIWRNQGDGSFRELYVRGLALMYERPMAWGDYDNDGLPDLAFSGPTFSEGTISDIWRNVGDGSVRNIFAGFPRLFGGTVAWADFNNDGKLDLVLNGTPFGPAGTPPITEIWLNHENSSPRSPGGLRVTQSVHAFLLSWDPASDFDTPSELLTYSVRVGTVPGASDIADATTTNTFLQIAHDFRPGSAVYWTVQAVDPQNATSVAAKERNFSIGPFFSGFGRRSNGVFEVQLDLQGGTNYILEGSSDLIRWIPLTTFQFDNSGQARFTDPASTNFPARFYRFGQW